MSTTQRYILSVSYRDGHGVIRTYEETTEPTTEAKAYDRFVELQDKYNCDRYYYLCIMTREFDALYSSC